MGMPTAVFFTKIKKSPDETLPTILNILPSLEIEVDGCGKLGLDNDGDMVFINEIQVKSWINILELSAEWRGFALSCMAYPVNERIYIYFWHDSNNNYISMEVPGTVSIFETDQYEVGFWLKNLLLKISSAINASACVYGRPYDKKLFSSIEQDKVLDSIMSGNYFKFSYPNVNLISSKLIEHEAIKKLYKINKKSSRQDYGLSLLGYHVLSFL